MWLRVEVHYWTQTTTNAITIRIITTASGHHHIIRFTRQTRPLETTTTYSRSFCYTIERQVSKRPRRPDMAASTILTVRSRAQRSPPIQTLLVFRPLKLSAHVRYSLVCTSTYCRLGSHPNSIWTKSDYGHKSKHRHIAVLWAFIIPRQRSSLISWPKLVENFA